MCSGWNTGSKVGIALFALAGLCGFVLTRICFGEGPISVPLLTVDIYFSQVLIAPTGAHVSIFFQNKMFLVTSDWGQCLLNTSVHWTRIRFMFQHKF